MKVFNLLQTKYQEFNESVKAYISKTLSDFGTTYGNNTVFGQLINVVGSVVQNIMLYIEDAMTEQNKYTAQRKKSIYGLAVQSGYIPSLGKAATCNIKLTFIPSNFGELNVVIPNKTRLMCSQNGLMYNIVLPQENIILSIDKDNSYKYLQVVEGNYETQQFYSTGGQLYTQNVTFNGDVDIDFLEVTVNNELWERVDSLYDMNPDGKQYVCRTSLTKGFDLIFGNEQFGRALKEGDQIVVTYLSHSGELGNIDANQEVQFIFMDNITNIGEEELNANEIFNISLVDTCGIGGGTYGETTKQVKNMIGYNSRSLVLASPLNYKRLINQFSFCGYNRTWGEEGSLVVNSLILKNYKMHLSTGSDYFNLSENDFFLSDSQKTSILTCIENSGNQLAGVTLRIFDPELVKYAAYIYIKPKSGVTFDKTSTENKIRDLIGNFMANVESDIFIPKSDIVHLIKSNISVVDSVDVYFLSEKNETAIITNQYVKETEKYNPSTGTYDVTKETIYVEEGEDPGLGLDNHGNIYLDNNHQFPVLMGGWKFQSSNDRWNDDQLATIKDPLIIIFE